MATGAAWATATGAGLEFVSVSGGAKKSGPEGYDVVIFGEGKQASYSGGTALTKEMIYVAVSVSNGCECCIHSQTAAARKKRE